MKATNWIWLAIALGVVLSVPLAASATLIGDQIDVTWWYPNLATPFAQDTVTVGASVEIDCPGPSPICAGFNAPEATIDIGASTISYNHPVIPSGFNSGDFNGFEFSDLDWVGDPGFLVGFTRDTNIAGLDVSRVAFGDDFIRINLQGLAANTTDRFFVLTLDHSPIPEPTSAILFGAGLLVVGSALRRRAA